MKRKVQKHKASKTLILILSGVPFALVGLGSLSVNLVQILTTSWSVRSLSTLSLSASGDLIDLRSSRAIWGPGVYASAAWATME